MKARSVLLIDNYDSFTYNLLHYVVALGVKVDVVRNDALSVAEITARTPDGIIISPGPGEPKDAGVCPAVIAELGANIPILGVCLGHQAIGEVYGGTVVRTHPMHGKTSLMHHEGASVFARLPSPFTATRYHSLVIDPATMPDCLIKTAWTDDSIIMGVAHKHHPVHGVQFHPESIASEHGHALIANFLAML
jgi:anthranilate synthase component II